MHSFKHTAKLFCWTKVHCRGRNSRERKTWVCTQNSLESKDKKATIKFASQPALGLLFLCMTGKLLLWTLPKAGWGLQVSSCQSELCSSFTPELSEKAELILLELSTLQLRHRISGDGANPLAGNLHATCMLMGRLWIRIRTEKTQGRTKVRAKADYRNSEHRRYRSTLCMHRARRDYQTSVCHICSYAVSQQHIQFVLGGQGSCYVIPATHLSGKYKLREIWPSVGWDRAQSHCG